MNIESLFTQAGGEFCIPYTEFTRKLSSIRAFIFDWDGVFNDGAKDYQGSSNFNEVDSMGTNLLRFSRWSEKKTMPFVAVMSGEKNLLSFQLTQREHYHEGYFSVKDKKHGFNHFIERHSLQPHEVAFVFDDALDLSVAAMAGLRILVSHGASPLFKNYVVGNKLADYITGQPTYAVREACELLMGATGNYNAVIGGRAAFSDDYKTYLEQRQSIATEFFTWKENSIQQVTL